MQQNFFRLFIRQAHGGSLGVHLFLHQRCQDPAGANRVAGHACGGVFKGCDLGQAHHAVLGRHISGFFGRTHQAVDGCHVDDTAPVGGLHGGQGQACGVEGAGQVDGDDGVPALNREVFDAGDVLDARVVHQDVDAAKGVGGELHHGFNLAGFAHVGAVVSHFHAQCSNFGLGAFGITKTVQNNVGALLGQCLGDAQTDTAG